MNISDILIEQDKLYEEAEAALGDMDLLNLLSKFGKPEVIGSMALKVLTRRDIDIEVISDNPNREDVAKMIYELVLSAKNRIDFDVTNNTNKENPYLPEGFYVGMKYFGDLGYPERKSSHPDVWTVDIWLVKKEDSIGRIRTNSIKNGLTEDKRKTVLEIKHALKDNPNYHKKYGGVDIYDAVIKGDVKTLDQFGDYLRENGKEL